MDFRQAESRYRVLKAQRAAGEIDDETYRLEVAKLLVQGQGGVLWMLDGDQATWVCDRGEGWEPRDPHAEPQVREASGAARGTGGRAGRWLALVLTLLLLLSLAGGFVLWQVALESLWSNFRPTANPDTQVEIVIASPADGSQVVLGQEIAIESTIDAPSGLQDVDRAELVVNGKKADSLQIQTQTAGRSLPLSQPWRPGSAGEYRVSVVVYSSENQPLGSATVTLQVVEAPGEALAEPVCVPNASFVADVTIPPGTVFPPSVRMDKVWQVRNTGSCAWGVGYELVRLAGSGLISPDAVLVPPTAAGETVDLAVTLWSPPELGAYADLWRLRSPEGDLFGPTLPLTISVEALAKKDQPPHSPANLTATINPESGSPTGPTGLAEVQLAWSDQSDNEDAFRIYRSDQQASIGLAPAGAQRYLDEQVACGNTYRYTVVAFNSAGTSPASPSVEITLPPCVAADMPPALSLTVVPTQLRASEPYTLVFQAGDDLGLNMVIVWGVETGDPVLDSGRAFTCTGELCTGGWPLTWTQATSIPLTLVAVALDSLGQKSDPAWLTLTILPPQPITPQLFISGSIPITDGTSITDRVPITR